MAAVGPNDGIVAQLPEKIKKRIKDCGKAWFGTGQLGWGHGSAYNKEKG
jgi:hypothetical protein